MKKGLRQVEDEEGLEQVAKGWRQVEEEERRDKNVREIVEDEEVTEVEQDVERKEVKDVFEVSTSLK